MKTPLRRPGTRLIKEFDGGEKIVSMIEHGGRIYVATDRRVFRQEGVRLGERAR